MVKITCSVLVYITKKFVLPVMKYTHTRFKSFHLFSLINKWEILIPLRKPLLAGSLMQKWKLRRQVGTTEDEKSLEGRENRVGSGRLSPA